MGNSPLHVDYIGVKRGFECFDLFFLRENEQA
jgi:hypothetical protein